MLINTTKGEIFKNELEKLIDRMGIDEYLGLPAELVAGYLVNSAETYIQVRLQEEEYYTKINARLALIMGDEADARESGLNSAEPHYHGELDG
jgi:hypothetical protein